MPRDIMSLECTEARAEGKSPSRYMSSINRKKYAEQANKTGKTKFEKLKYNPSLRRHTLHREVKK
jgi:large subunit ribosomal protein L33